MLYQNDDFGKDYLAGLKDGLGDKFDKMVVKEVSYEMTDPTVDSQVVSAAGLRRRRAADRGDAEIRGADDPKVGDLGWKPMHLHDQRVDLGRRR